MKTRKLCKAEHSPHREALICGQDEISKERAGIEKSCRNWRPDRPVGIHARSDERYSRWFLMQCARQKSDPVASASARCLGRGIYGLDVIANSWFLMPRRQCVESYANSPSWDLMGSSGCDRDREFQERRSTAGSGFIVECMNRFTASMLAKVRRSQEVVRKRWLVLGSRQACPCPTFPRFGSRIEEVPCYKKQHKAKLQAIQSRELGVI